MHLSVYASGKFTELLLCSLDLLRLRQLNCVLMFVLLNSEVQEPCTFITAVLDSSYKTSS